MSPGPDFGMMPADMRYDGTVLILVFAAACGTGAEGDDDSTGPVPTMCGMAGQPEGTECAGVTDCGRGPDNFVIPEFCEHCPGRAETHVCEAGTCKQTVLANIDASFVVPAAAAGAKSFTIATFNPVMADGGRMTCAALTSTCGFLDNEKLNSGNSRASPFQGGAADPAFVYTSRIFSDVGADRLVFIQAVTETQGKGTVMARGCAEGFEVQMDEVVVVPVELEAI